MHGARRLSAARRGVKPAALLLTGWLAGCDAAAPATAFRGAAQCGDGRVEDGEACDLGFANRPDGPCRACALPRCGDGVVDDGEDCDEGEMPTGRCTAECTPVWPRQWTRTIDQTGFDEPVIAILPLGGGDFVHVGAGPETANGLRTVEVTRRTAGADVVWRSVGSADTSLLARAITLDDAGTTHVLADSGDPVEDETAPRLWLVSVSADGQVRTGPLTSSNGAAPVLLGRGEAMVSDDGGFWVAASYGGPGMLWRTGGEGVLIGEAVPLPVTARALASLPGGLFVGTGTREEAGAVMRLDDEAGVVWEVASHVARGEVIDLHWDGARLLVLANEVTGGDELAPALRPTQIRVSALSGDGETTWSTVVPGAPREGRALAIVDDEVVVIGRERLPASVCSDNLCPTRPWLGTFDAATGQARRSWLAQDVALGEGTAVAVDDDAVLLGGGSQRVFARPDGWLVRASRAGAP